MSALKRPADGVIPVERDPRHLYTNQAPPYKRPRSCEELGICQGRYPACGQCDDPHPEDEPPTPSPMDQIYAWCISGAIAVSAVAVVGVLALAAGATVHFVAKLWPL